MKAIIKSCRSTDEKEKEEGRQGKLNEEHNREKGGPTLSFQNLATRGK